MLQTHLLSQSGTSRSSISLWLCSNLAEQVGQQMGAGGKVGSEGSLGGMQQALQQLQGTCVQRGQGC